ncbi:MAG TPA: GNAT family N-acetyltransferase [Streptosporangiaceae bacterium]
MVTRLTLCDLTASQFLGQLETSLAIYADAMDADPSTLPGRRELMRRHAGYPAFRALQALILPASSSDRQPASSQPANSQPANSQPASNDNSQPDSNAQVAGFAYGFHGQSGQWWFDAVWQALARTHGAGRAAVWLADSFEIAEVHVYQQFQRGGIGTAMLLSLTGGRPERTAVLSTPDRDSTARRLYRRMGFTELLTGYSFPGGSPPYIVMGAELPLRTSTGELARSPAASPSIS